ncbi:low molecular weight protein-tyrosine-phosphatase [Clostridium oryzae]|uniref:protein-tyrosine-phosphatase n=1 Tax=Clostridium oryzae TaxID=1450648 RepID=A0A1V4IWR6_9CLOT|nr:low molecular weight protein-tyrosine-phosphatase [Clostridium oryzae]OPJ64396.1 Low molecular weight protein-tyrosine-phosphatase YfkJ [Clostridium oryzae]
MIRIMFVCHGNICRSPMAEFMLKDMVTKQGLSEKFFIASSATSTEEIGNPVHRGTKRKLAEFGISTAGKYAIQLTKSDYEKYDFIIGMDSYNITNITRIIGQDVDKKVSRLLDFSDTPKDIADPWYTGNFDDTYIDVEKGCKALLAHILK